MDQKLQMQLVRSQPPPRKKHPIHFHQLPAGFVELPKPQTYILKFIYPLENRPKPNQCKGQKPNIPNIYIYIYIYIYI